MALRDLNVKFTSDTSGIQKGFGITKKEMSGLRGEAAKTNSGLSSITAGFGKMFKASAVIGGITAIIHGLWSAFKSFVSLDSSVRRTTDLFGEASKYITYFAENTAKSLGMAQSSAYQYAATYGNLFKNVTKDSNENAKVTIAMLKASSVIASKTGRTMDDVMERIRSGLLGNTEAIEDLGIYAQVGAIQTTDAFKKLANGKSWDQLDYNTQQQIRILSILEQTHKQFGDTVQKSSAFSLQTLSGAFKDLISYAGQFVNAGLQPIINGLTQLVYWAAAGMKALAGLFGLKIDTSAKNTNAQIDAQNGLTNAVNATAKAKQKLAGFDQINTLGSKDSSGSTGSGTGTASGVFGSIDMPEYKAPDIDTSALENKLKKFKGLFDFTNIKEAWKNLKKALSPLGENIGGGLKWLWDNILVPFGKWTINSAVPAFMNLLSGALNILNPVIEALKPLGKWLWTEFLRPLGTWSGNATVSSINSLADALFRIGDWSEKHGKSIRGAVIGISSAFAAWKLIQFGQFVTFIGSITGTTGFAALGKSILAVANGPLTIMRDALKGVGSALITASSNALTMVGSTAKLGFEMAKQAALLIKNAALWVAQKIAMVATTVATKIAAAAQAALNFVMSLNPIALVVIAIAALVAAFVILWKKCDGFREFWINLWNGIQNVASAAWSGIKSVFSNIKTWFVNKFTDAWTGIKNVFSAVGSFFGGIWDTIKEKFTSIGSKIGNAVGTAFKTVVNSIIWFAENYINTFIKSINFAIGLINKIPGVNIPLLQTVDLPQLATGGIVTAPTVAMIGERNKQEAILPLEQNTGWIDRLADKLSPKGGSGGGDIYLDEKVYLDDGTLVGSTKRKVNRRNSKSNNPILGV